MTQYNTFFVIALCFGLAQYISGHLVGSGKITVVQSILADLPILVLLFIAIYSVAK